MVMHINSISSSVSMRILGTLRQMSCCPDRSSGSMPLPISRYWIWLSSPWIKAVAATSLMIHILQMWLPSSSELNPMDYYCGTRAEDELVIPVTKCVCFSVITSQGQKFLYNPKWSTMAGSISHLSWSLFL